MKTISPSFSGFNIPVESDRRQAALVGSLRSFAAPAALHLRLASEPRMKYFTAEWWASDGSNAAAAFEPYEAYLASVRRHLPPALVELEARHTLHDSEAKRISCDFQNQSASRHLHGWDNELQYPVHYWLHFSDVSVCEQVLPQQEYVEGAPYPA